MKGRANEHHQDGDAASTAVPLEQARSGAQPAAVPPFELDSTDIKAGDVIGIQHLYDSMGCTGQNRSPALRWSHAPATTRSFAVTVYDPDARGGAGWWHWLMYDIVPSVSHLPPGAGDASHAFMPDVVQAVTSFGKPGYGGPCPPKGDPPHRYIFSVHALDTDKLEVPADATPGDIDFLIHAHVIASASLTVEYGR